MSYLLDLSPFCFVKGPAGQTTIPRVGDAVWVYFRLNRDGGYDLIVPDGIQVFRETKA
jgi:hypothetical protein